MAEVKADVEEAVKEETAAEQNETVLEVGAEKAAPQDKLPASARRCD